MALTKIYRGMQNAAETIWKNFEDLSSLFVKTTDNQTVLGVKNFSNGITFGDLLPAKRKAALQKLVYSSTSDPGMYASGSIEFQRDGNLVTCTFAFKPKNTHATGAKIVWSLDDYAPDGVVRIPTCEGHCYLYNDPADGNSIKIGGALSNAQWASGTMSWIAKNRI